MKKDYDLSLKEYANGAPDSALAFFPQGEEGGFITSMEKSYLNLVQGKPEISSLEKISDSIESRLRYRVSRELKSFFYLETPEGYYASEHEIVWLHFLLSWGYSLRGEYESACIEARQAAHLLTYSWSDEGHFDDPMMRIFLAGLWTMCGSWQDARVDLRSAWQLDQSLGWARELSEQEQPPRHLILILGGIGPVPEWRPEVSALNPLRGFRSLEFRYTGNKSTPVLKDGKGKEIALYSSPDSSYWYRRHLVRDNEIHELIQDSHYGNQVFASSSVAAAEVTTGIATGTGIGIVGLGAGSAVMYLGAKSNSEELLGLGLGIAAGGIYEGYKIVKRTILDTVRSTKKRMDPSDKYRFVRFLPEYLRVGWDNEELTYPVTLVTKGPFAGSLFPVVKSNEGTFVSIIHLPDVPEYVDLWEKWMRAFETEAGLTGWNKLRDLSLLLHLRDKSAISMTSPLGNEYELHNLFDNNQLKLVLKRGLFKADQILMIDLVNRSAYQYSNDISLILEEEPGELFNMIMKGILSELE